MLSGHPCDGDAADRSAGGSACGPHKVVPLWPLAAPTCGSYCDEGARGTVWAVESKPVLVYIYGPPAAGKLTVARRLAELSGLPLFHNHLTVDAVTSVLPFGSEAFSAVLHRFRLDLFETAVSTGQGLIFTNNSAWSGPDGRRSFAAFADEADRRVRAAGGLTLFVCLNAPLAALESRLGNDDRRSLRKLTDVRRLRELIEEYDLSPLHRTDLEIDTAMMDPEVAARAIQTALPDDQRGWQTDLSAPRADGDRPVIGAMVEGRAGRVLPVSPAGRVLLLRGGDPARPDAGEWWFSIGGGCEAGESTAAAARREAFEEAGFALGADLGPVVARRRARFEFEGRWYDQREDYYLVRVSSEAVSTDGWTRVEQRVVSGYRWWSLAELQSSPEAVYPEGLHELLAKLL